MIQLRTFGSIELTAAGRPAVAAVLAQPKRFALLVSLAIAAPRSFVRRDTLLALFWPETDQLRGRNVLRQSVYLLRQSLGPDAIISRGDDELGVDPAVLQCDVVQFEAALAAGRTAEALELYRGDFLVGFHVPDAAPELDEWIQSEARRLRSLATRGACSLARSEEQAGNRGGAEFWARRAVALDPLNEKSLADVMQLLVRIGDRAGALQVYQEYVRRAEADLGMEPSRDVQRLAESFRIAPDLPPPARTAVAPPITEIARPTEIATPAATGLAPESDAPRKPRRWLRRTAIVGAGIAVVAMGFMLWRSERSLEARPVIAIGAITDASLSSQERSNVPADLLSTSLARLTGLHVIPVTRLYDLQSQLRAARRPATSMLEAAKQAGAGRLIEGTLHRLSSGRLQLDLQVMDSRNGAVVGAYRAEGTDLFAAVDQATTLIADAYGLSTPREGIAQVTTTSLVAYRLYDQGLQAYYQDDRPAAYRLFRAALAEDTSFAMAAYYAGMSAGGPTSEESGALLLRAVRLASRVPDRERLLIQEAVAGLGMSATASALADTMAARYPLDPDAQFVLGHVSERRGDFLAAARQYRRVIAMDSLSLKRDTRCLACDAYERLWWSYLYADSVVAAERVAREFAAVRPSGGRALLLTASALARQGRTPEVLNIWRTMDSLRGGTVHLDLGAATLAIREGAFADADDRLQRVLREGSPASRERAAWYLILSWRNQGRHKEALTLTDRVESQVARPIVLFEMGRSAQAAKVFEAQAGHDLGAFPGHTASADPMFSGRVTQAKSRLQGSPTNKRGRRD
jgi:DNA-binding SARP family transcriptional activator/TolB-like protein